MMASLKRKLYYHIPLHISREYLVAAVKILSVLGLFIQIPGLLGLSSYERDAKYVLIALNRSCTNADKKICLYFDERSEGTSFLNIKRYFFPSRNPMISKEH